MVLATLKFKSFLLNFKGTPWPPEFPPAFIWKTSWWRQGNSAEMSYGIRVCWKEVNFVFWDGYKSLSWDVAYLMQLFCCWIMFCTTLLISPHPFVSINQVHEFAVPARRTQNAHEFIPLLILAVSEDQWLSTKKTLALWSSSAKLPRWAVRLQWHGNSISGCCFAAVQVKFSPF